MREFELIIDEAFRNGLSPLRVTPTNSQLLYECLGYRLGKAGLEQYEVKYNFLPPAIDMHYSWPFPQFISGERYNFLIVRDSLHDNVYTVSDDMDSVSLIASVDNSGTLMEVADFGKYAIMVNGVAIIYWDELSGSWLTATSLSTVPMLRTICSFKGQAIGGNVVSDWYDCDETFYVWSRIGSIDFTLDKSNISGYRRCPFGGTVHNVRRLGNVVVGYSSKGLVVIEPVQSPSVTFGFVEVSNVGIINQGAVNGNYDHHVYVGEDYILREVTNGGVKDIGYERYIEQLTNGDIIVSYDKKLNDFYISDGTKTFLLSPSGLTEIPQHPSAVWRLNNSTCMLPDTEDSYEPIVTTFPFDMSYRGQKTVCSIESDVFPVSSTDIAIDYCNDSVNYYITDYKPINNQGTCSITVSGNSFRFKIRGGLGISYIKARYKMTDLRSIKGVYAPPPRGQ